MASPAAPGRIIASLLFAQPPDGGELSGQRGDLSFDRGDFLLARGVAARLLGPLQRLGRLGFVEIATPDRGIREYRDHVRLNLENSASHEDELLLSFARNFDAYRARPDAGDQRGVARIDAELARLAGQYDELGLARENRFLGADDVYVDGRGSHRGALPYFSVFAFSTASSIVPTI